MVTTRQTSPPVRPIEPLWQRHRIATWAVALGSIVLVWFFVIQPRTVTAVNEDFPTAAPRPATNVVNAKPAAKPLATIPVVVSNGVVVASPAQSAASSTRIKGGVLMKVTEGGTGSVTLYTLVDGSTIARLDHLQVPNGPDLHVVLRGPNGADLDLGALKGNVGNQTYPIPPGADLTRYDTLAIYCRAFHVVFTQAALS